MRWPLLLLGLTLTGCATAPLSPTVAAVQTLQLRERADIGPSDWYVRGASHAAALARLIAWTNDQGIVFTGLPLAQTGIVGYSIKIGGAHAWIVLLDQNQSPNGQLHTLLHELAHVYSPPGLWKQTSDAREVFAELVASQVCARLGLETWPETAVYLNRSTTFADQDAVARQWSADADRLVVLFARAAGGQIGGG